MVDDLIVLMGWLMGIPLATSLDSGRNAWEPSRTHDQVLDHHACHGDPIVADRLVTVLLARLVQADVLARCSERGRQVQGQTHFFADRLIAHIED